MLMEWRSNMEIEQVALQNWMINLERDGIFKVIKWINVLAEEADNLVIVSKNIFEYN